VRAGACSDPNLREVNNRADSLVPRRCVRAGAWSDPNSREDNDAAASCENV
jgi:hypothetical protein